MLEAGQVVNAWRKGKKKKSEMGLMARDGAAAAADASESDAVADYVSFFSVLTHLTPKECLVYLGDAKRVLRPGGKIIASYLDKKMDVHRQAAGRLSYQIALRILGRGVKNTLLDDDTMIDFGKRLDMTAQLVASPMGQKICVYTKR